jgi:spermidine synthase
MVLKTKLVEAKKGAKPAAQDSAQGKEAEAVKFLSSYLSALDQIKADLSTPEKSFASAKKAFEEGDGSTNPTQAILKAALSLNLLRATIGAPQQEDRLVWIVLGSPISFGWKAILEESGKHLQQQWEGLLLEVKDLDAGPKGGKIISFVNGSATSFLSRSGGAWAPKRVLNQSEGVNEIITVTETTGKGRRLMTNGHAMSATWPLSQRYMRALAHVPLLMIDNPERLLVIGFGVGNTTAAATLHPTVNRVEVADLSRNVLNHATFFSSANNNVLKDGRVVVYVNDGRHHLQVQPLESYDLIALEPPPIGYAGVAALYSEEFYALARTRLKPNGFISQWLPSYQVPTETTLSMIRAFIDVFPRSVLLSGAQADLILIGAKDRIEIDPNRLLAAMSQRPAARADLARLDLGTPREIVGMFLGSAEKLADASRDAVPVTDDRPVQEYGVRSLLNLGASVPAAVVDLTHVAAWCPSCFDNGVNVRSVEGLDLYLALLNRAYTETPQEGARVRQAADEGRIFAGSAYLGAVVPEVADVHNHLGIALASKGQLDAAIGEFRRPRAGNFERSLDIS